MYKVPIKVLQDCKKQLEEYKSLRFFIKHDTHRLKRLEELIKLLEDNYICPK